MLVLTRKHNESLLIGDDIKITIVSVGPNSVRIGIDAPPDTIIVRHELLAKMKFDHRAQRPRIGRDITTRKQ